MGHVTIRLAHVPDNFLRIDGRHTEQRDDQGSGFVNVQSHVGGFETLELHAVPDHGENVFAISSTEHPDVYLRMDASSLEPGEQYEAGMGLVNCQLQREGWELFVLVPQDDGSVAIRSFEFPHAYLRLDPHAESEADDGYGAVNCQGSVGDYEKFLILPANFGI